MADFDGPKNPSHGVGVGVGVGCGAQKRAGICGSFWNFMYFAKKYRDKENNKCPFTPSLFFNWIPEKRNVQSSVFCLLLNERDKFHCGMWETFEGCFMELG